MVTGGLYDRSHLSSVEVVLPPGVPSCSRTSLPSLPKARYGHLLFTLGDLVLVCGGWDDYYTDTCYELQALGWAHHSTLTTSNRFYAGTGVIDSKQCILGGESFSVPNTIECWGSAGAAADDKCGSRDRVGPYPCPCPVHVQRESAPPGKSMVGVAKAIVMRL